MHLIDISDQISSTIEPTVELRWQPRGSETAYPNCRLILQQKWRAVDSKNGRPTAVRYEWRDVPTASE